MIGAFLACVAVDVAAADDNLAGLKSRLYELRKASGVTVMLKHSGAP